jgi:hypothetical protein
MNLSTDKPTSFSTPPLDSSYVQLTDKEEKQKYNHFGDVFSNNPQLNAYRQYVTASGTCQGDSGGPAYIKAGEHFVVIGEKHLHLLQS